MPFHRNIITSMRDLPCMSRLSHSCKFCVKRSVADCHAWEANVERRLSREISRCVASAHVSSTLHHWYALTSASNCSEGCPPAAHACMS